MATVKEAKEYLEQVCTAKRKCQQLAYKIAEIKTSSKKLIAVYEMTPRGSNRKCDISDQLAIIEEKQNEMMAKYRYWIDQQVKIGNFIESLNISELTRSVLILRYIKTYRWEIIANELHISSAQVFRENKKGIEATAKKMNENKS